MRATLVASSGGRSVFVVGLLFVLIRLGAECCPMPGILKMSFFLYSSASHSTLSSCSYTDRVFLGSRYFVGSRVCAPAVDPWQPNLHICSQHSRQGHAHCSSVQVALGSLLSLRPQTVVAAASGRRGFVVKVSKSCWPVSATG